MDAITEFLDRCDFLNPVLSSDCPAGFAGVPEVGGRLLMAGTDEK